MAEVGYSGTPLVKKLGIRAEMKVLVIHEPDDYFSLLGITISNQYISKKETRILFIFLQKITMFLSKK